MRTVHLSIRRPVASIFRDTACGAKRGLSTASRVAFQADPRACRKCKLIAAQRGGGVA